MKSRPWLTISILLALSYCVMSKSQHDFAHFTSSRRNVFGHSPPISFAPASTKGPCQAGSGTATPCNDVLIAMDVTYNMNNNSFITEEYLFVRDELLPAYNLQHGAYGVALSMFGFHDWAHLNLPGPFLIYFTRTDIGDICEDVDEMQGFIGDYTLGGTISLSALLDQIQEYANKDGNSYSTLVIFTATKSQREVDMAGEYYRDKMGRTGESYHVVLIGVNNPEITFTAWAGVATVYRTTNFHDVNGKQMGECIASTGCAVNCQLQPSIPPTGYTDHFYSKGTTAKPLPTKHIPPTVPATVPATVPVTVPVTVPATSPTTEEPPSPGNGTSLECACDVSKIWLDIMFIVDSTTSMTKNGLNELEEYILTALYKMSIGQQIGQVSRVGLIVYGDTAQLIYPLTTFTSADNLLDSWHTPFMGTNGSNIYDAISLANAHFSDKNAHRSNAKQVLVIAASHYDKEQYNDPTKIAEQFKGDGGVIITLEYVQTHGTKVPNLDLLASPNFVLTNSDDLLHAEDLQFLFCQANCFCHTNWEAYATSKYATPTGGCYSRVSISSSYRLAERQCVSETATLTEVLDSEKALFIASRANAKESVWTGLQRVNGQFVWANGDKGAPYTPWGSGEPNYSKGDCVKQNIPSGFRVAWSMSDCTDDAVYVCQANPCDSVHYCTYI